jgi:S-DNA-T family DNA segregation ATPase FtsK/SpoIIIE
LNEEHILKKGNGRISLVFGCTSIVLAVVFGLGILMPSFGLQVPFVSASMRYLAPRIGLSADGNLSGMIPLAFLLVLWSIMAFTFRGRRRFSFVLVPVTGLMYATVYLLAQTLQQTGRPEFLMEMLFADNATLHDASLKVVIAFLVETALFVVLTLVGDVVDRRYLKKQEFEKKLAAARKGEAVDTEGLSRRERKRLALSQRQSDKPEEDEAVVVIKKQPSKGKASGKLVFPTVMEVPTLDSFSQPPAGASQVRRSDVLDVEEVERKKGRGVASAGALDTVGEEHRRRKSERKQEKRERKQEKEEQKRKEPLSGFLQAALDAVGKGSASKSSPVPPRTGKARGMLAEAVAEKEAGPMPAAPSSVTIANPVEVTVSMDRSSGSVAPTFRQDSNPEPEPKQSPEPVVPEFYAPQSTAKPKNGGIAEDIPDPVVETDGKEDDLEAANGVGGLGRSALLSKGKLVYEYPPENILVNYPTTGNQIDKETVARGEKLLATLMEFHIQVELVNIVRGPTVTMFEILPAPGVRVNTIVNLADNIALSLAAVQVRIVAPIPGRSAVGIEIPNRVRDIIGFKQMITHIDSKRYDIPMVLGKNLLGEPIVIDVGKSPHLLIAGATGSGKSVCVNSMICSILYRRSPKEVRLILVDPKIVELNVYNGIPHLLTPVITDPKKTLKAFDFCLYEMDRRYRLLQGINARNITGYNEKIDESHLAREKLPFIVVVIDEFADLMHTVGKELENKVSRLAAMSRAVGIHLILATQRPSVDVITGVIKSNIPTRIAFAVTSTTDSRIIIDEGGAEKLLGKGDMLYVASTDPVPMRIQGAFLSDNEVEKVVRFASKQGVQDFIDESFFEDDVAESNDSSDDEADGNDDEMMERALQIVVERKCASASYLQRRLKIGYNRAARLVEQMEEMGYVGPPNGSKPRELLKYPS